MILIILKIFGIVLLVFTGMFLLMLFIRFKVRLRGEFSDNKGSGEIELYWVKYLFDLRCRLADTETLHFVLRLFFIPIPFHFSLKSETVNRSVKKDNKKEAQKPRFEKEMISETTVEKEDIRGRLGKLVDTKDQIHDLWDKYYPLLKNIYVRYITLSWESLTAKVGFPEPSQTAMAAGMSYIIIALSPFDRTDIQWDFNNPGIMFALRIKITMKLYGIFCKLIHLYWIYNKGKKNETE